ncbi:RING-type domain-containing protein, partial [Haematococcus lacustris]
GAEELPQEPLQEQLQLQEPLQQDAAQVAKVLAGVVPQVYRLLSELPSAEFQAARKLLHGSRCVFVGSGFAPSTRVALKVPSKKSRK